MNSNIQRTKERKWKREEAQEYHTCYLSSQHTKICKKFETNHVHSRLGLASSSSKPDPFASMDPFQATFPSTTKVRNGLTKEEIMSALQHQPDMYGGISGVQGPLISMSHC